MIFFNFKSFKRFSKGFTLIELLIVIAVVGIMAAGFSTVFTRFNQEQSLGIATDNLKNDLAQARSYAQSNVDVIKCSDPEAGIILVGYRLVNIGSSEYQLQQICKNSAGELDPVNIGNPKKLPSGVTISGGFMIRFNILNGGITSGNIMLKKGNGDPIKVVEVDSSGVIR